MNNFWSSSRRFALALLATTFLSQGSSAQILNGDFENNAGTTAANWTNVQSTTILVTYPPVPVFDAIAQMETPNAIAGDAGAPVSGAAGIADRLDVLDTTFTGAFPTSQGSAIFQDFTGTAGDVLSFTYNFSDDTGNNDRGYYSLVFTPNDGVGMNGTTIVTGVLTDTGGAFQTLDLAPLAASGTYRIGFAAFSTTNNNTRGNLQVSLVGLNVPEIDASASTLPLATLGLVLLVLGDARRRRATMSA